MAPGLARSFSFRSGRIALDFAATLMFREGPNPPRELLVDPSALADWLVAANVVTRPPTADDRDLARARALRESIYRLSVAAIAERRATADDRALLNRVAATPDPVPKLNGIGRLQLEGDTRRGLSAVARDAVTLLGGSDAARLRQCGRSGCTRLFVDRSRGANRRWCGMRTCGNRVNAAAYRLRQG